jgi:flagellin
MSVITNSLQNPAARSLSSSPELLARTLARLAAGPSPSIESTAAGRGTGGLNAQTLGVQAASADAQNALSSTQTAAGYLASMSNVLARMGRLAGVAQSGALSPADLAQTRQEFSALQGQLRGTIGGSANVIGGSGVSAPAGSFQGADLFGPAQGNATNPADLRRGAMLKLISQDSTGAFGLNVTDPNASADVAGALGQVTDAGAGVKASQSQLELAAAKLQIEQQNLFSVFSPLGDPVAAQQANQFAQDNILKESGTALLAQTNLTPAAVLNLVQG